MASNKGEAPSPTSDNDTGERPVRKQLKETSIDSATTSGCHRKRSFDESREDDDTADTANADSETGESRRKRSRENSPKDSEHVGTQTVSSPVSNPAPASAAVPSDSAKEDALEPVDLSDFSWIAHLEERECAVAKRSRELEARPLALERELLLQKGEAV